jgi:hypothetical protein
VTLRPVFFSSSSVVIGAKSSGMDASRYNGLIITFCACGVLIASP